MIVENSQHLPNTPAGEQIIELLRARGYAHVVCGRTYINFEHPELSGRVPDDAIMEWNLSPTAVSYADVGWARPAGPI